MPVRLATFSILVLTAAATAGCMPFGREARAPARAIPATPTPLAAAPTAPVTQSPLPPPPGTAAAATPGATAGAATSGRNVEVGRTDLLGGWTLASGGDSCQLFMSLTTWSGGDRATTRGCNTEALKGVSAWNLEGSQVMLLNDSGGTVARLSPTSKTQFNGLTQGGGPVSVSR
jgi:hypothetical protein